MLPCDCSRPLSPAGAASPNACCLLPLEKLPDLPEQGQVCFPVLPEGPSLLQPGKGRSTTLDEGPAVRAEGQGVGRSWETESGRGHGLRSHLLTQVKEPERHFPLENRSPWLPLGHGPRATGRGHPLTRLTSGFTLPGRESGQERNST